MLAECPALAGLSALYLHRNDLTDAGAKAVLDSPLLRRVRALSFWDNPRVTDATARAVLADRRAWEKVELGDTAVSEKLRAKVEARCAKYRPEPEA